MRALFVSLFGSLVVSGTSPAPAAAEPQPTCVKVQAIGALPLTVDVGGAKVTFTEWMAKDADASELIGFRATATGTVSFVVRAGGETFESAELQWMNPHGVVGRLPLPGRHIGLDHQSGLANSPLLSERPPQRGIADRARVGGERGQHGRGQQHGQQSGPDKRPIHPRPQRNKPQHAYRQPSFPHQTPRFSTTRPTESQQGAGGVQQV
jgi:hypothetical protein